jgi:transcriptional regulator with XRE-family HTH domain
MAAQVMSTSGERFAGLLVASRGRTRLTQRPLAAAVRVSLRAVQAWEAGVNYPAAERLRALVGALFEGGGLTEGHEREEAESLWAAVLREAPHMRTPFDIPWFDHVLSQAPTSAKPPASATRERREDRDEAPDTMDFVGRADELAVLLRWVLDEHSRVLAVLGIGGVGKTNLAARLAQDVAPSFERVYWRSLRNAPAPGEWLAGAIAFVSDQQLAPPSGESERVGTLLRLLRERRCLLVLDNFEAALEPGQPEGSYRADMEGYGRIVRALGEASHQSCLMLTSREVPPELSLLDRAARTLELGGFGVHEAQVLLVPKQLDGTAQEWVALNERLGGNGLALKVVGEAIRELFGGEIGAFLEVDTLGAATVFNDIRRVLAEQVDRGSALEQQILRVLAVEREPMSTAKVVAELGPAVGGGPVLEAIESLRRRSLVERTDTVHAPGLTLQSVVLEFVNDRLVDSAIDEIAHEQPVLLLKQPLIKAAAQDYVRQTQERLIGSPILERLKAKYGQAGTEQQLLTLLGGWRGRSEAEQGFGPGNVVNLLRVLRGNLCGLDLSHLVIRQGYLAETEAQDASVANAQLDNAVLADAFDFPVSVALSGDDGMLAVGTSSGQICVWRVSAVRHCGRREVLPVWSGVWRSRPMANCW